METSPDLPLARPHSTAADPGPWPFSDQGIPKTIPLGTSKSSDFYGETAEFDITRRA